MRFWLVRRLRAFFLSPEAGPLVLAAVVSAWVGTALGFTWVPWSVAVGFILLVITAGNDEDDPQHPVLA